MTPTQRAAIEDFEHISAAGGRVEFVERRIAALRAALAETAPVQEPVAWWKQYPDGSISVVESRTFLAEDAVAMGWRALGFTDVAPQAQQPAPPADVPMLTDEELSAIYKQANGEDVGKAQPLTTQRIFKAMRAASVRQKAGLP